MLAMLDYVREAAMEHPILEPRRREVTMVPPNAARDAAHLMMTDDASMGANRAAVTALHEYHNGNVLSPLAQIDKVELLSRTMAMEVMAFRSAQPLFGELQSQPRGGIASGIIRAVPPNAASRTTVSVGRGDVNLTASPIQRQRVRMTDDELGSGNELSYDDDADDHHEEGEDDEAFMEEEDNDEADASGSASRNSMVLGRE